MNNITTLQNQLKFLQSIRLLQVSNKIIMIDLDLKTYMITLPLDILDWELAGASNACKHLGHEGTALLINADKQLPVCIMVKFVNDKFIAKHFVKSKGVPLYDLFVEMAREYTNMRESEHLSTLEVPGGFLI
jgi:hypothetical protein